MRTVTFEEAKEMFPIGKQITCFGDTVPECAHDSIEEMTSWISIYVANEGAVHDGNEIKFDVYE